MVRKKLLLLLFPGLLVFQLPGCGAAPEADLKGKTDEELIRSLRSEHWRERERAVRELIVRETPQTTAIVFRAYEEETDARVRDRLRTVLHKWGLFALSREKLARILTPLTKVKDYFEAEIPLLRTSDDWRQTVESDLASGLGIVLGVLENVEDGNAQAFRDDLEIAFNEAIIVTRQGDKKAVISALAAIVRKLADKINSHNLLFAGE